MAEEKNINIVALQEKDVQLVVSKETIGQLTTNIKEVKARVEKALPMYDISNYSTDDIPKCKEDKALLNKAAKALDDKRKELERVWNKPFEEFKTTCNETCKLIKNAVSLIDGVIKEDENRTKKAKREEIEKLAKKLGVEVIGVHLDLIFDAKWLNKTTSMKYIEKAITEKVDNIKKDLETLKLFAEDYDALAVRYKENLNLQETIAYANKLKEQRANSESSSKTETAIPSTSPQKEVAENDAAEQQEEQPKNGKMSSDEEDAMDAFAAAMGQSVAPPTPTETHTYVCSGTKEAMECLERFMRDNGITFNVL